MLCIWNYYVICQLYLNLFLFFKFIFERETERACGGGAESGRDRGSKASSSCQQRAWCRARTHEPWDHDLSQSRTLNWLSHPGVPMTILNKSEDKVRKITSYILLWKFYGYSHFYLLEIKFFVWCEIGSNFFFSTRLSKLMQHHLLKRQFSPLHGGVSLVINQETVEMWVCFWTPCSSIICLSLCTLARCLHGCFIISIILVVEALSIALL